MPLYRLTFRDKNRKKLELEVIASSMQAAIERQGDNMELIQIERLDDESGEVIGAFYTE
jgi:hypothetical protein